MEGEMFDFNAVLDQLWSLAELLEKNGHPWLGQGLKAMVTLSKGER